jgi:hypothetical protein
MRRTATLLILASLTLTISARAEDTFQDQVNRAIDKGVEWLKKSCDPYGNFGLIGGDVTYSGSTSVYRYPHGCTALALLTLLKCGVAPDDEVVKRGFAYIDRCGRIPETTYEIAALIMAIEARTNQIKRERKLEAGRRIRAKPGQEVDVRVKLPRKDFIWVKDLTKALLGRWKDGGWRYGRAAAVKGGTHDMSNTQLAMLALYTASRCGVKIPSNLLRSTILWTLDQQEDTGPEHERFVPRTNDREYAAPIDHARGWAYIKGSESARDARVTGTMTTGGILVLVTARAILKAQSLSVLKPLISRVDRGILDGIAWLDKHWRIDKNPPGPGSYHTMYLYGLERVGDLLRVHLIGEHEWYREGAEWLVPRQVADGRWYATDTHKPHNLLNTCFALLFLEKASLAVSTESEPNR